MKINFNITSLLTIILIYMCFTCESNKRVENIKECLVKMPSEICIKIYKGF
jgi:hypothetical protein